MTTTDTRTNIPSCRGCGHNAPVCSRHEDGLCHEQSYYQPRDWSRQEVIDWCREQRCDFKQGVFPPPRGWAWATCSPERPDEVSLIALMGAEVGDDDADVDRDDVVPVGYRVEVRPADYSFFSLDSFAVAQAGDSPFITSPMWPVYAKPQPDCPQEIVVYHGWCWAEPKYAVGGMAFVKTDPSFKPLYLGPQLQGDNVTPYRSY